MNACTHYGQCDNPHGCELKIDPDQRLEVTDGMIKELVGPFLCRSCKELKDKGTPCQIINHDITQWFEDNYKGVRAGLDANAEQERGEEAAGEEATIREELEARMEAVRREEARREAVRREAARRKVARRKARREVAREEDAEGEEEEAN